jgi:hypothetical protein
MHKVINVELAGGYKIRIHFEDGFDWVLDFENFLQKGVARELLEKEKFDQVYIESGGGLAWENGFDFCPNFLYEAAREQTLEHA